LIVASQLVQHGVPLRKKARHGDGAALGSTEFSPCEEQKKQEKPQANKGLGFALSY
jgi:hypothetical protein